MHAISATVISDQKVEEGRKDRYIPEEEKGIIRWLKIQHQNAYIVLCSCIKLSLY